MVTRLLMIGLLAWGLPAAAAGEAKAETVFVCDATGSAIATLESMNEDVLSQVGALADGQRFNIVVIQGNEILHFQPKGFATNSPAHLEKVRKWLAGVHATGSADPLTGLADAMKLKPKELVLLSDFDLPKPDDFFAGVRKLNPRGTVKIHSVYLFVGDGQDALSLQMKGHAERLAKENGGTSRTVKAKDPPPPPPKKKQA